MSSSESELRLQGLNQQW